MRHGLSHTKSAPFRSPCQIDALKNPPFKKTKGLKIHSVTHINHDYKEKNSNQNPKCESSLCRDQLSNRQVGNFQNGIHEVLYPLVKGLA